MGLKQHIGFLVILAVMMFIAWLFDINNVQNKYDWTVPFVSAFMVWLIAEVLYWLFYYFFIV